MEMAPLLVTELSDFRSNPTPVQQEQADLLMDEYLSITKLMKLTGSTDLSLVTSLSMIVDTTENSLGNFGVLLPSLSHLKLSNSIISSVRDVGTSLNGVTVLWMARCGLCDLDGISSLAGLCELFIAFNDISDISPVTMLDDLQTLDLEGNNIDDIGQVEFLGLARSLVALTLEGNPVTERPTVPTLAKYILEPEDIEEINVGSPIKKDDTSFIGEQDDDNNNSNNNDDGDDVPYCYRNTVVRLLPALKYLDDEAVTENDRAILSPNTARRRHATRSISKAALRPKTGRRKIVGEELEADELYNAVDRLLINETIKYGYTDADPELAASCHSASRPQTATTRRPGTANRSRPGTALQRPGTANRPRTAKSQAAATFSDSGVMACEEEDASSMLTFGSEDALCGNPVRALHRRCVSSNSSGVGNSDVESFSATGGTAPVERDILILNDHCDNEAMDSGGDIFSELLKWKEDHKQRSIELEETRLRSTMADEAFELNSMDDEGDISNEDDGDGQIDLDALVQEDEDTAMARLLGHLSKPLSKPQDSEFDLRSHASTDKNQTLSRTDSELEGTKEASITGAVDSLHSSPKILPVAPNLKEIPFQRSSHSNIKQILPSPVRRPSFDAKGSQTSLSSRGTSAGSSSSLSSRKLPIPPPPRSRRTHSSTSTTTATNTNAAESPTQMLRIHRYKPLANIEGRT